MTRYNIQNILIFSKTQSGIIYTNAQFITLSENTVAYLLNYFSAQTAREKGAGGPGGMGGAQCHKDPSFFLALNQSPAKLSDYTGTHCLFQSGLKYVISHSSVVTVCHWIKSQKALKRAYLHLLVQSFLLLSYISCQYCGINLIHCQHFCLTNFKMIQMLCNLKIT